MERGILAYLTRKGTNRDAFGDNALSQEFVDNFLKSGIFRMWKFNSKEQDEIVGLKKSSI